MATGEFIFDIKTPQWVTDHPEVIVKTGEPVFLTDGRYGFGNGGELSTVTFFGGSISWGNITGDIANQTDLISYIDTAVLDAVSIPVGQIAIGNNTSIASYPEFTFTTGKLKIGTSAPLSALDFQIVNNTGTAGISITNPNTGIAVSALYLGQDGSNYGGLSRLGTGFTIPITGTSIAGTGGLILGNNASGDLHNEKIVLAGMPIYCIAGASATNYGIRLDATGFRLDTISSLHTSNSSQFSIGTAFTYTVTTNKLWINPAALTVFAPFTNAQILVATAASADISVYGNTGAGAHQRITFGHNNINWGEVIRYSGGYSGNFTGSSIPLANVIVLQNNSSTSNSGGWPVGLHGSLNYLLTGITGTNAGLRNDTTGIRIDALSNLHTAATSWLNIGASIAAKSQINLATGVAPTSPINGDIWFDGVDLKIRIGGITKTFTVT